MFIFLHVTANFFHRRGVEGTEKTIFDLRGDDRNSKPFRPSGKIIERGGFAPIGISRLEQKEIPLCSLRLCGEEYLSKAKRTPFH
jgi:hypothetical protein